MNLIGQCENNTYCYCSLPSPLHTLVFLQIGQRRTWQTSLSISLEQNFRLYLLQMYSLLVSRLMILFLSIMEAISAPLAYFGLSSSFYLNQVPVISPPLHEFKLSSADCARSCMLDDTCWSWYAYPANGTSTCVHVGTNLCREPNLTFRTATSVNTIWWEKVLNYPTPCANRSSFTRTSSTFLPATLTSTVLITSTTSTSVASSTASTTPVAVPTTVVSSSSSSTLSTTTARPTCTGTTCGSCQQCNNMGGGIPAPAMVDHNTITICNIWPNGASGLQVTLPCTDSVKPVLLYRKVEFNTTNVIEYILTPEEMYAVHKTFSYSNFEIRFRTRSGMLKVSLYKVMSLSPGGELTLSNYTAYDNDLIGVPVSNAPFVNSSQVDPACGPFWDMQNSSIANNGTAFGANYCPGYLTAFYGKPGFYNGTWRSGISFPSYQNEIVLEILIFLW